jgi:hypothetical protein
MGQNPIENNLVTRFLLGFAVVVAMILGGELVGVALLRLDVPYGDWIGVAIGAVAVFVAFTVLYRRYDAAYDAE